MGSEPRWGKESPRGPLARLPPAVLATVAGLGRRGAVSTAVPSPSPHPPTLHPARPPVVPPVGPSLRLFSPSSPCLLRARPSLRPRGRVSPVRFPLSLARLGSGLPRRLAAPPRAPPAAVPSARPGLPGTLRIPLAQLPPRLPFQPRRHRRPLARPPAVSPGVCILPSNFAIGGGATCGRALRLASPACPPARTSLPRRRGESRAGAGRWGQAGPEERRREGKEGG